MTTIIISILAALGIGGGVMLASSGGGSSSGGAAVVAPVNPGGGAGGGSNTGGEINPNLPSISPFIESASTSSITTLGRVSKGNTTLENKTLTIGMAAFAPVLITSAYSNYLYPTGNEYRIVTEFRQWKGSEGTDRYIASFGNTPNVQVSFNLNNITDNSNPRADFYQGDTQTQQFFAPKKIVDIAGDPFTGSPYSDKIQATWTFIPTLALGGRKAELQHSDFGYYKWWAGLSGTQVEQFSAYPKAYMKNQRGGQQFYIFDNSRQLLTSDFGRYANSDPSLNNIATFHGNVIGIQRREHFNCGMENILNDLTGDITLTLNFNLVNNKRVLTGSITNVLVGNQAWYDLDLGGYINNMPSASGSASFNINSVTYNSAQTSSVNINQLNGENLKFLTEENSLFGSGAIVKGDTPSQDEVVGGISFVGKNSDYFFVFTNLAFGAKKGE